MHIWIQIFVLVKIALSADLLCFSSMFLLMFLLSDTLVHGIFEIYFVTPCPSKLMDLLLEFSHHKEVKIPDLVIVE